MGLFGLTLNTTNLSSGGGNSGLVTTDVSTLVTGGAGTFASPYTGWVDAFNALLAPNRTFWFPSAWYDNPIGAINWGKHANVKYHAEQGTILKSSGSPGVAVNFANDGATTQTDTPTTFHNEFLGFTIDGNGIATHGLKLQSIHHSLFDVAVRNVTGTKFYFIFTICNKYYLRGTSRVGDADGLGEETTFATKGIYCTHNGNTALTVQECEFYIIIEYIAGNGVEFHGAHQNKVFGTSEENGGINFICYGNGNTLFLDNEYAPASVHKTDFLIVGNDNILVNCLATGLARVGDDINGGYSFRNKIIGGRFTDLYIDKKAKETVIISPQVNLLDDPLGKWHGYKNFSKSTIVLGAPIDRATGLPVSVAMDIPNAGLMRGDVEFLPTKSIVLLDDDNVKWKLKAETDGTPALELYTEYNGLPVTDDFSEDTKQWMRDSFVNEMASDEVGVEIDTGELIITLANGESGSHFAGFANQAHDLLEGGFEQIKYVSKPSSGAFELRFGIGLSFRSALFIIVGGTTISYATVSGGSPATIASITFNAVNHAYWRFRRSGANVVAELSADAAFTSPVTLGTYAISSLAFSLDDYGTCIEAGSTASGTFDAPVKYADYRYVRG